MMRSDEVCAVVVDNRAVSARVEAMEALRRMGLLTSEEVTNYRVTYQALRRVLGYPEQMDEAYFCAYMTDKDVETLELLAGPHGYAIYKMLEARKRRRIIE